MALYRDATIKLTAVVPYLVSLHRMMAADLSLSAGEIRHQVQSVHAAEIAAIYELVEITVGGGAMEWLNDEVTAALIADAETREDA